MNIQRYTGKPPDIKKEVNNGTEITKLKHQWMHIKTSLSVKTKASKGKRKKKQVE